MDEAIDAFAEVGADQTPEDAAREKQEVCGMVYTGDFVVFKTTLMPVVLVANASMIPAILQSLLTSDEVRWESDKMSVSMSATVELEGE